VSLLDYYRKIPLYTGKGYNVPSLEDSEWPSIRHSQYDEVVREINQNVRLVISGRRRIGKSFMISQIAHNLWRGQQSVFYIGLPQAPPTTSTISEQFLLQVHERLEIFDNTITKPTAGKLFQTSNYMFSKPP
jgi:hypothetical protein